MVARAKRSTWLADNRAISAPVNPHLSNHDIVAQGQKIMRRYFAAVDESSKVQVWSDTYCGFNGTAGAIRAQVFFSLVHCAFCFQSCVRKRHVELNVIYE